MTRIRSILLAMLRSVLREEPFDASLVEGLSPQQWKTLFRMAATQGVLVMLYDCVNALPRHLMPPKSLHIKWAVSSDSIKQRYHRQLEVATEFAEQFARRGIDFYVLKGLAVSSYYPAPETRECGDVDCFLGGRFADGDKLAAELGAKVEYDFYKHSHIEYRGVLIENHRYCISVRGDARAKQLERELERLISRSPRKCLASTQILLPPAEFNVLFLARHALLHFLNEGINLRHICDWYCLLRAEQGNVDWAELNNTLSAHSLKTFTDAVTGICVNELGLEVSASGLGVDDSNSARVLDDIFGEQSKLFSNGYGKWRGRYEMIRNVVHNRWRYDQIYGHNFFVELLRYAYGFVFERNPKI